MSMITSLRSWVARNVGGQDDYRAADSFVNGVRREGFSGAAVGAGVGAVAGGVGGFAYGMANLAQDTVQVQTQVTPITRPVLVGADFDYGDTRWVSTDDKGGGYFHTDPDDWDALIEHRATGQNQSREVFRHSTGLGPVGGALIGIGGGAVLGAITGAIAQAVSGRDGDPWPPRTPKVPETDMMRKVARAADHAPLAGAGAGAVLGGIAGFAAGSLSAAKAQTLTQTLVEPVYRNELLGWIPYNSDRHDIPRELWRPGHEIYYRDLGGRFGTPPFQGREEVWGRVPTGEYTQRVVTESSHGLTPLTGTLLGAGVGAVTGALGGVAAGVLMKVVAGEDPPRGW